MAGGAYHSLSPTRQMELKQKHLLAGFTCAGLALVGLATWELLQESPTITFTWTPNPEENIEGYFIYFFPETLGDPVIFDTNSPTPSFTLPLSSIKGFSIARLSAYDSWGLESTLSHALVLPPSQQVSLYASTDLTSWNFIQHISLHGDLPVNSYNFQLSQYKTHPLKPPGLKWQATVNNSIWGEFATTAIPKQDKVFYKLRK